MTNQSKKTKPRHKRLTDELITLADWCTERLFTYRLIKLNTLDSFIEIIKQKYADDDNEVSLSFSDWHNEEEAFIDLTIDKYAETLWCESDSNCPELLNIQSDDLDLAVILPEPCIDQRDIGNLYRISYYRKGGAYSHGVYKTFKLAVKEAVLKGYVKLAVGTLDSLVGTLDWNRGLVITSAVESGLWMRDYLETIATSEERSLFNL